MKHRIRWSAVAITFLSAVMALSALFTAPVSAADSPVIAAQKCDKPGKLTFWVWDDNWKKTLDKSVANWVEKYCPGAEVNVVQQPWDSYWTQLKTSASGGDLPDIFNLSQDRFYAYAQTGAVLNLQPYWDKYGVKTSVWGTGLVDPYRYGDKGDLYAAPVNWDTVAIFYNKDLFDAAKIAYPTADWTWDDFASAAAKLTDSAKDVYGADVYVGYQTGYPNWIASAGVSPVVDAAKTTCTLTDKVSVDTLNFLKDLEDKGYQPKPSIVGGTSADDVFNFFAQGKVAIISGGSWKLPDAYSKLKFNWDVVQFPKNPTTKRSRAILHAVGYVAAAKTKEPDLAANLILYLSSDEGQQFFAAAGGVAPANPSPAVQKLWIDSFKAGKNVQAFVDATKDSQGVTAFDQIWDVADTQLVVNIFDLGKSVDESTKAACSAITPFLQTAATPAPTASK